MQIAEIMSIVKTVTTIPQTQLQRRILNAIQCTNGGVRSTFFPSVAPVNPLTYQAPQGQARFNDLAVQYMAFVLSLSTARSFHTTVRNVGYGTIQTWFGANGTTLGLWMMLDVLLQDHGLARMLDNHDESLQALLQSGKDSVFVSGFLVECDTEGSYLPAKLFLHLYNVLDPSGQALQAVLPVWQNETRWTVIQNYAAENWFETVTPLFAQDTDAFNTVKGAVDHAISIRTGPYSYTRREVIDSTPTGMPIYGNVSHERYEYGETVLNWLNLPDGPLRYGMRSGNMPDNYEEKKPDDSGCVREHTPIRMADGSVKPVQDLVPGDLVLNGYGTFSVCSTERIHNPFVREMYGINDEPPFMSPEHALMTDRGWCSLNPYLSRRLNPGVSLHRLQVGDMVWRFGTLENGRLAVEKVPVLRIHAERAEAGEGFVGYDLHFSEGYHSYFARDYLCLLSYPEITVANLLANLRSRMSPAEEIRFIRLLRDHDELFRKVFGHEAMNHFHYSISRQEGP
ncbi:hypothetical protein [Gorillibacterium sp. sgz5001074]|uniref:hypothetical protein n=1 Tax=Gorillibacterium sp. sgz5001074 TaxID=3446695 RepID=UPI003F66C41E